MANFSLQDALGINYQNTSTRDKLQVVYKAILKNLLSKADYLRLVNREYSDTPAKGGSVHIDRLAFATVRDYGTAFAAQTGDKPLNNGIDILVNIDKEIVTEVPKKDAKLWRPGGEAEILAANVENQTAALQIFLDDAYFVALQQAATTYDVSAVTDSDAVKQQVLRLLALIRKLESVTGDNVNKIDRSLMALTLSSEIYDSVELYMTTLNNPDGNSVRLLHGVEVSRALRQDVDAVVQVKGSMGMPMVLDRYEVTRPTYKNGLVQELYFSYGLGAVMPECIYKAAISSDNSISI